MNIDKLIEFEDLSLIELIPFDKDDYSHIEISAIKLSLEDLLKIFQIQYEEIFEIYKEFLKKPESEFKFQKGYSLGKMSILKEIISIISEKIYGKDGDKNN